MSRSTTWSRGFCSPGAVSSLRPAGRRCEVGLVRYSVSSSQQIASRSNAEIHGVEGSVRSMKSTPGPADEEPVAERH
jgi:hypothetical protein